MSGCLPVIVLKKIMPWFVKQAYMQRLTETAQEPLLFFV
ncbi:hypothetical protein C789_3670 [Microcystis aeruginosa FACHB-905 = DIANCHI905]|nr:hypothetical protein C789_3670 [Microcystis aeruginosa FACHB-905 = DIANCHI905]